jgi:hypothetical protein
MDPKIISRIDRAVADNMKDIKRSFGGQAGIVQDFIVFITRQLKIDLFGYTRFTLQQFCQETGRTRQDLAVIHPDFLTGKSLPPTIAGYEFKTVFDYALYTMMERNIIFSSGYEVRAESGNIQMQSFSILKDLKLNFNRSTKEQKIYDVRLSDDLLHGFLSRYYTIDTLSYRLVGKGRGGDSRKQLLIYLSKLKHILLSTGTDNETLIPLDRLCRIADIFDIKPSHKKQNLSRMLAYIRETGKFLFDFQFTQDRFNTNYMVRLEFKPDKSRYKLQMEHSFYYRLLSGLKTVFDSKKAAYVIIDDDPFQFWLADMESDLISKSQVLVHSYYIAFQINLNQTQAQSLIRSGNFLKPLLDVG